MPSKAPGAYVIGIDAHLIDVETDIIAQSHSSKRHGRQHVDPCKAMFSSRIHREYTVVNAITDCLSGKPVPSRAGA